MTYLPTPHGIIRLSNQSHRVLAGLNVPVYTLQYFVPGQVEVCYVWCITALERAVAFGIMSGFLSFLKHDLSTWVRSQAEEVCTDIPNSIEEFRANLLLRVQQKIAGSSSWGVVELSMGMYGLSVGGKETEYYFDTLEQLLELLDELFDKKVDDGHAPYTMNDALFILSFALSSIDLPSEVDTRKRTDEEEVESVAAHLPPFGNSGKPN